MSTKSTDLYGENFHVYHEAFEYLPTIEFNDKKVKAPKDFLEALNHLIHLQNAVKAVINTSKKLDEIDGGLFAIDLSTGEKKEFR